MPHGFTSEQVLRDYHRLEMKVSRMSEKIERVDCLLEETNRLLRINKAKAASLKEENQGLLQAVKTLEDKVEEHKCLTEENVKMKAELEGMKKLSENLLKLKEDQFQHLVKNVNEEKERHNVELKMVREQFSKEMENARKDAILHMNNIDQLHHKKMEEKNKEAMDLKMTLKTKEVEAQNKMFKLEMEYRGKLAQFQEAPEQNPENVQQDQPRDSLPCLIPHSVYKRKLVFLQQEKDKEIEALRKRIKELEEARKISGSIDPRMRRRRM